MKIQHEQKLIMAPDIVEATHQSDAIFLLSEYFASTKMNVKFLICECVCQYQYNMIAGKDV
eukprot:8478193-Ditylum_brightwellii.AAC.1